MTMQSVGLHLEDWIVGWTEHARQAYAITCDEGYAQLVSYTTEVSVTSEWLIQAVAVGARGTPCWYWSHPSESHTLLGIGCAHTCCGAGEERFVQLRQDVRSVETELFASNPSCVRWLGGFSFESGPHTAPWSNWADASLTLPQFLFEQVGPDTFLTVSTWVHPDDDLEALLRQMKEAFHTMLTSVGEETPAIEAEGRAAPLPHATNPDYEAFAWKAAVEQTAADIRSGDYTKVVLARHVVERSDVPYSVPAALARLRLAYEDSFVYAVYQHGQCFLGATPERLVRVVEGSVAIDCLAGTVGRGHTAEQDIALGQQLLQSAKNRAEHAVVVRWVQSRVEGVVEDFTAPAQPTLKKLKNVQHLYTPVRGRLVEDWSVLDVAARLHPTPAVAGEPREIALNIIRDREQMDRGWYAGAVGWVGVGGDGEFSVALRCALIDGREAHLFAGCGIMGDSDAEQEWLETRLKLRPMEMALRCGEEGEA